MAARRQPMEAPMQMPTIKVIKGNSFHLNENPIFPLYFLPSLQVCNYSAVDFKTGIFVTY